ncbi:MAG TPA: hypothetical protein VN698_03630 [Bacteroidia bacterium]|nr:hypothetical protein [Bacteroidia bacterium]
MTKKTIITSLALATMSAALIFSSCKKKEEVDSDTTAAEDHTQVETHSNDVENIGEQASYGSMSTYKLGSQAQENIYSTCATITSYAVNSTDNDTLLVDFGTGCTGADGRTRSGSLQYIYSAGLHYRDSGNVINVSSNNYVVDGNSISIISKTIKNKGHITNGNLTWTIDASMSVTKANGKTITWTTSKTKVLLAGERPNNQPIDWAHAQIAIFGTASGTSANGQSFTASVAQATWLVRNFNCTGYRKCFVAGELDFTPGSKPTRYINFGTGNCDADATVTINGHVYNVTLH